MIVNSIIDAICITINNEFGDDYTIYTESIKQGFEEPCFLYIILVLLIICFWGIGIFVSLCFA